MRRHATLAGKALLLACLAAAPIMIHWAIVTNRWTAFVIAIPLLQFLIVGGALMARRPLWIKALALTVAILGLAWLWPHLTRDSFATIPGIPHALAYSSLLFCFAWSLTPGREAILTRAAAYVRGPLPPDLYRYTRRVTAAWCVFFACQLVISAALFIWAPLEVWSFFINVLNLPLVLTMFVVEYVNRVIRFPTYRHDSISEMMQGFAKAGTNVARQADSA